MLGHEHVVEHRGVGAGRAQARAEPGVVLLHLRHRHQIEPHVGMILAVAEHQPANHDPLRVPQAAAPGPAAVELVAAGGDRDLAGRRGRGGDARRLVAAPDVVLRLFGKMRQDAGVVAEIVQAPGGRATGRLAELDRNVERDLVVVLVAAPALGLQRMDQAGVDVFVDRLLRDVAVALRLHRALAQLRRKRLGAGDKLLGAGNIARRGCRLLFGKAHGASSDGTEACATEVTESSTGGGRIGVRLGVAHRLYHLAPRL